MQEVVNQVEGEFAARGFLLILPRSTINKYELTHERQVALAAAKTCGKRFFATGGGQHLTADDGFIAAEMCFREAAVKEKEKEKKSRMEGNTKRDAALIVLDHLENHLDGNVHALLSKELKTLLKWEGVQVSKMGDKVAKRALYKKTIEEGGGVETAYSWTDADEEELEALKNAPIEMADTSYDCYEAEQKRNVVRACRKMTPEERENLLEINHLSRRHLSWFDHSQPLWGGRNLG
jgi:hypothetical protein